MFIKKLIKRYRFWRLFKRGGNLLLNVDAPAKMKIYYGKEIKFSGSAYIGEEAFIDARGGLEIGNNVIIGPRVAIFTYNHDFKSVDWAPYSSDVDIKPVIIGDNVWIGYGAIILPGSIISSNCLVAAGSVVRGNFVENTMIAGNPASVVSSLPTKENPKQYQSCMSALRRWG